MAKGVRKSISIPGLLAEAAIARALEFGHQRFSPLAVDLVCYDLRSGASHALTLPISLDSQTVQDAVDRELVARYKPGQRRGGFMDFVKHLETFREVPGRLISQSR